jgi:hypothetical protein
MSKSLYYLAKCLPRTSDLLPRARRILSVSSSFALALGTWGCSVFSTDSSTSLALEPLREQGTWQRVQASPYVYQSTELQETFLTGIRDCSPGKIPSPAVAARQLLVGLKEIRIEEQRQVTVADFPALHSRIRARLEDAPLDLEAVTLTHNGCVYDFVLWRSAGSSTAAGGDAPSVLLQGTALSDVLALRIAEIVQ